MKQLQTTTYKKSSKYGRMGSKDPQELCAKVLDQIPIEALTSAERVIDLACGYGGFADEYVRRVEPYIGLEEALNRIWLVDNHITCVNRCIKNGYKNVIHADALTWNSPMSFNVVITNPPYQDNDNKAKNNKLWMKFVELCFDLCEEGGNISLVTPTSFVGPTRTPAKNRSRLLEEFNLHQVDYTSGDSFDVGVDICSWSATKEPYSGETKVIDSSGERTIDLRVELPLPSDKKVPYELAEKIEKVIRDPNTPKIQGFFHEEKFEEGEHEVFWSGRNKTKFSSKLPDNSGRLKLVASFSASYRKWFVTDKPCSGFNKFWFVDSHEEGVELGETFSQPVLQFFLDTWRKTSGFTPAIKCKDMIPDLRGMTDQEINDLFDLTEEEVELIYSKRESPENIERVL